VLNNNVVGAIGWLPQFFVVTVVVQLFMYLVMLYVASRYVPLKKDVEEALRRIKKCLDEGGRDIGKD